MFSLGLRLRSNHVKRRCACFEKELPIEAGQCLYQEVRGTDGGSNLKLILGEGELSSLDSSSTR